MSLSPQVCKKNYKVHIPSLGEECEFWLVRVTEEQSIANPDKDHAYYTDDGKLFIYDGKNLVRVNCDICFTQEEREKLEDIEEGANKYVLPVANDSSLGGIKTGFTQTEKQYAVEVTEKGQAYVTVPWTDTVYTLPVAETNTLGGIKTGYEQQGKNYPVLVDIDGNAYVNVPWNDTDRKYNVVSTTENGLAPMLPTENADKKFLNGDGEWVEVNESINGNTVTDSTFSGETSDCGVQILEVQGKTVQQTTNGYQLFDASKLSTKSQGGATITNNGDGSFTISGSGNLTETFAITYDYSADETKKLIKNGTLKINNGDSNPYLRAIIRDSEGTAKYIIGKDDTSTDEKEIELLDGYYMSIQFLGASGSTINPKTITPMLYQLGDGTFEPFTGGQPAPNPDYPMDIENVDISNFVSHSYNLYDASKLATKTQGGATVTNNGDGSFTVSGSGSLSGAFLNQAFYGDSSILKLGLINFDVGGTVNPYAQVIGCTVKGSINNERTFTLNSGSQVGITEDILSRTKDIALVFYSNSGAQINPGTVKPMLYQEGDGTWQKFGLDTVSKSVKLAEDDIYKDGEIMRFRKKITFDENSSFTYNSGLSTGDIAFFYAFIRGKKAGVNNFACDKLKIINTGEPRDREGIFGIANTNIIYILIKKSRLSELSTNGLKMWLENNPIQFEYETETPTTEEFKVPTIPSYEPYTEISTNSVVDPTITFRPLPFTTCLVGEATEEESGYMPPLSGNSNEFLNGNGEWSVPSGYTLPQASKTTLGGVKIGSNITVSSGTISLTKANVVSALGSTPLTRNEIVNLIYPVGSLYMSTNSTNPSTLFGGTWQPYAQGRCLIGAGQGDDGTTSMSFTTGQSGGEYTHKLTIDEMPSHQHDMQHDLNLHGISGGSSVITAVVSAGSGKDVLTSLAGGDGTHNNVQPYIACNIWRRTA